ncbi:altered inheritance of mitochondria protein 24, mitochondrial [Aspergillus niger]|nr:altered inheritance of mitochondria protein 24, mitochondrial [Aspergillus niger]
MALAQPWRSAARTLSWTRVVPPRARQGALLRRGWQTRCVQIRAAPAEEPATVNGDHLPISSTPSSAESAGLTTLASTQVVSTLSVLEPFRRAVVGVPFLYQKVRLVSPGFEQMSLAHWGSSEVTGRGLLALVGNGQLYSVELKAGEQYIVHPSNVVAYTMSTNPPRPYRFKSTTLRFQVPGLKSLPAFIQNSKFIQNMSESSTWKSTMRIMHTIRTWSRKTIWGDRLFLQFDGPSTILLQTRGPRINEVLTSHEVNEIASAPRGLTIGPAKPTEGKHQPADVYVKAAEEAVNAGPGPHRTVDELTNELKGTEQSIATLTKEGKVIIEKIIAPGIQTIACVRPHPT